jgi:hypothetical protein
MQFIAMPCNIRDVPGVTALKLAQEDHRGEESALRQDKRALKVELKEMELSHEEMIKSLQREYDMQVSRLRDDLQRQARVSQLCTPHLPAPHPSHSSPQSYLPHAWMLLTAKELQLKYDKKMVTLREELDLRRKTEIVEVEERKNFQISTLMRNHEKAFADIKNYYNDITLNNLALINSLKEQVWRVPTCPSMNRNVSSCA